VTPVTGKPTTEPTATPVDTEPPLPPFAEQVAQQLGGVRGLIESSVPVAAFVVVNVISDVKPAVAVAVATALGIAVVRLTQRRPIRHAVNGLFGIALGAWLALRSGEARDFYLPGIFISLAYAAAMVVSVALRQPIVGWLWSIVMAGGKSDWREQPRLVRKFSWLTLLWAATYLMKVGVQTPLYLAKEDTALGIARLALGYPPYAMLLALTVWAVRRESRAIAATAEQMPTAPA
jgi:hypothetical protein